MPSSTRFEKRSTTGRAFSSTESSTTTTPTAALPFSCTTLIKSASNNIVSSSLRLYVQIATAIVVEAEDPIVRTLGQKFGRKNYPVGIYLYSHKHSKHAFKQA